MTTRRRVLLVGVVVTALFGVVAIRAVWQGRAALARGERALAEGRVDSAISHYRRAARWYLPLAPHVSAAYARLETIASGAEEAGDAPTALSAWRGIRSSALATRHLTIPFADRLAHANQRIAVLMAALEGPNADPGVSEEKRAAWHRGLLDKPVGPKLGFTLLAIAGFLAWVAAAFWFAWSGLGGEEERLERRVALRSGILFAAGLLAWVFGLYAA